MGKLSDETVSCIEQIIITLLEENRYSFQVSKSISFISKTINKPIAKLDKSIDSLRLIDSYLSNLNNRNEIDLETLLSITIYLSQVVILSFDGIWIIEDEKTVYPGRICYSDEDRFLTCSVKIQVHNSCDYVLPHHILMINSGKKKSDLNQIVNSLRFKKITQETYVLSRLDLMIQNGDDFHPKIPFFISTLSMKLDIPMRQLTKSINSLKSVDKAIRLNGKKYLVRSKSFDDLFFLSLVVYVGEVIIKNVSGKWEVNVERVVASNVKG